MPTKENIIEVKDLSIAFGRNTVLDRITFSVPRGDYVGIIGPNGGGKTTLLKILTGLLIPDSGEVIFSGSSGNVRPKIGYVPQQIVEENVNFPATVYEVVESGLAGRTGFFSRISEKDREAMNQALKFSGVSELAGRLIGDLSGGQRQRVYVARALAGGPEILILDEPFVGVDAAGQKDFYAFLKRLNEEEKITVIFVSHDIDVVAKEVKSILCLNRGLLCSGSPSALNETNLIEKMYGKKIIHIHH